LERETLPSLWNLGDNVTLEREQRSSHEASRGTFEEKGPTAIVKGRMRTRGGNGLKSLTREIAHKSSENRLSVRGEGDTSSTGLRPELSRNLSTALRKGNIESHLRKKRKKGPFCSETHSGNEWCEAEESVYMERCIVNRGSNRG